jgi:L-alanine-DL-glutamate epimerase-like enolase superfamily enzyme
MSDFQSKAPNSMPDLPDRLHVDARIETWKLATPLTITGYTFDDFQSLTVTISDGVSIGRGEATGVYYRSDTPDTMLREVDRARELISAGISRDGLLDLLPHGGARNAVDCALWALESERRKVPVWQVAGMAPPVPLTTTMTIGAADPEVMARQAVHTYPQARAMKLKLLGDGRDVERVTAVREARADVWLGVDANQGFTRDSLFAAMPHFVAARVLLIEQPFAVGEEALLDGLDSPISIAADESVQSIDDLKGLVGRVQTINIKLDKCGGLTAALMMSARAKELGFRVMVGSMPGTSLAMAPAFLVGQACDIVDLDAPLFLSRDRQPPAMYVDGTVEIPPRLWGWSV